MRRYLAKRLGTSLLTVLGIVVVLFFIVRVVPGDAASLRAGPYATEERIDQISDQYGLNDPLFTQFIDYITGFVRGDLGVSIRTDQPVLGELMARLPASLELAVFSVGLAALIGWDRIEVPGATGYTDTDYAAKGRHAAIFDREDVEHRLPRFPGGTDRPRVGLTGHPAAELAAQFGPLADQLAENETVIIDELNAAQGNPVDIGGYYDPDTEKANQAMRPSATFNGLLATLGS